MAMLSDVRVLLLACTAAVALITWSGGAETIRSIKLGEYVYAVAAILAMLLSWGALIVYAIVLRSPLM
jgi:hypothetical protein